MVRAKAKKAKPTKAPKPKVVASAAEVVVTAPTAEEIAIYGNPGPPVDGTQDDYKNAWATMMANALARKEALRIQPPESADNDKGSPVMDALGNIDGKPYPDFLDTSAKEDKSPRDSFLERGIRNVQIFRDHELIYPALCFRVYVAPDPAVPNDMAMYARLFSRSCCSKADTPEEADLVIFSGGSDVNPALYGQSGHNTTWWDNDRDEKDTALFNLCKSMGIPMVGVCRGAQFLHVMNGGQLYQDVDSHSSPHAMVDVHSKEVLNRVSSVHHQMVMDNTEGGMEIIGVSRGVSECRHMNAIDCETGNNDDIEAFYYRKTGCLGVQGHPEYQGFNRFSVWFLEKIDLYISLNHDFEWDKASGRYRMRSALVQEEMLLTNEIGDK
jgi:gamma-glutamyl-gamma-aminobutyrate hydrolase PuuD